MSRLPRPLRLPGAPQEWDRKKLQILLGISGLVAIALVAGLVMSVVAVLRDEPTNTGSQKQTVHGSSENEMASAELPDADLEAAQPGPLTTRTAKAIVLPAATDLGPAGVPTGFPRTPEGAMAQLAAIDRAALEPGTVGRAQEVIADWAAPRGPTPESWSGVQAVASLLSAAGLPASGSSQLSIRVDPAMGFIKGTVGEDFVIPCIDFVITATAADTNRIAAADCQRMVWEVDRWVIGPGSEPTPAPSLWPGTEESIDAGYLWLQVAP